ncbi:hypothetical protein [Streptomyces sp. 5-10]|uniref:hypothetical protein n=1 Tax=Streptomyces sp. 5-10 TaxID=878925 RepID=UPI00168AFDB6|nr:hypothetical protein [Streptomyces sp. 5-10]MBD3004752.1 hypothetical protein [Streptomyces sp. 5-10]
MTDTDRKYGLDVLDAAFAAFAELIEQNGGQLPEHNTKALTIYVQGATANYSITRAEVDEIATRKGVPLHFIEAAASA